MNSEQYASHALDFYNSFKRRFSDEQAFELTKIIMDRIAEAAEKGRRLPTQTRLRIFNLCFREGSEILFNLPHSLILSQLLTTRKVQCDQTSFRIGEFTELISSFDDRFKVKFRVTVVVIEDVSFNVVLWLRFGIRDFQHFVLETFKLGVFKAAGFVVGHCCFSGVPCYDLRGALPCYVEGVSDGLHGFAGCVHLVHGTVPGFKFS